MDLLSVEYLRHLHLCFPFLLFKIRLSQKINSEMFSSHRHASVTSVDSTLWPRQCVCFYLFPRLMWCWLRGSALDASPQLAERFLMTRRPSKGQAASWLCVGIQSDPSDWVGGKGGGERRHGRTTPTHLFSCFCTHWLANVQSADWGKMHTDVWARGSVARSHKYQALLPPFATLHCVFLCRRVFAGSCGWLQDERTIRC